MFKSVKLDQENVALNKRQGWRINITRVVNHVLEHIVTVKQRYVTVGRRELAGGGLVSGREGHGLDESIAKVLIEHVVEVGAHGLVQGAVHQSERPLKGRPLVQVLKLTAARVVVRKVEVQLHVDSVTDLKL